MKLEEIKEKIIKASYMGINELVCNFQSESRYANMLFNSIVDTKDERKAGVIIMMIDAEIRSLIYENELKDRLEKGEKAHEYSVELEYKNDDLNVEIKELRQKIEEMQKPIEKETE